MTVREMYYKKYCAMLKRITKVEWDYLMKRSKDRRWHPVKAMYLHTTITVDDIRANGGYTGELWQEIKEMHGKKLMASNAHRHYGGHKTAYWLTPKGFNHLNKDHAIC